MSWLWLCLMLCMTRTDAAGSRIVGGQETNITQVPYLVYLRQSGKFLCGGSLLTIRLVLTAAHCVYGAQAKDYQVHAGASRLDNAAPVVRSVSSFHIAPNYAPSNFDMDVAILQLESPVPLIVGQVSTIAPCRTPPSSNAYARISGWGVTRETGRDPAAQVNTAMVRVLPSLECQVAYAGRALLSDAMLCAAVRGIKDSCYGDSGGPLVHRGQVCGIVSWGFGCARAAYPGVYASVASPRVRSFIEQTLRTLHG